MSKTSPGSKVQVVKKQTIQINESPKPDEYLILSLPLRINISAGQCLLIPLRNLKFSSVITIPVIIRITERKAVLDLFFIF
jgi:hypothetical protein